MTEDHPRVGAPAADDGDPRCAFSAEPGAPQCANMATMHLRVQDEQYGQVNLPTCQRHHGIAMAAGELLQQHQFQGWCGFPGALWDIENNECIVDESGVEPELVAQKAASPPHVLVDAT